MGRAEQLAVHLVREEGGPLVSHIVRPGDGVEPVSGVPDPFEEGDAAVEVGVEHVLHPVRFLVHGDENGLGSAHPRMGHVESEPERGFDPAALRAASVVVVLQPVPRDAVVLDGHSGFRVRPCLGSGDRIVEEFRGGVQLLELLERDAPRRGVDNVAVGLFDQLLFVARGNVHADPLHLIDVKIIPPVHAGGHSLLLPAAQGSGPDIVNDGDPVRLPVREHPAEPFVGSHDESSDQIVFVRASRVTAGR